MLRAKKVSLLPELFLLANEMWGWWSIMKSCGQDLQSSTNIAIKGLPSDPSSIGDWKNDLTTWPAIDLGKIFSFILSKKEFHNVEKYKMCKAYSYFASGFVGTVYSHNFDVESICILHASI